MAHLFEGCVGGPVSTQCNMARGGGGGTEI